MAGRSRRNNVKVPTDADLWPLIGRCARCVRFMIIDPEWKCTVNPGSVACTKCASAGAKCDKVSRLSVGVARVLILNRSMAHCIKPFETGKTS